jgi:PhoH-like ATPase
VKNYILDTNVLLHDPNSFLSFQDNRVLIPIEVIEEIDRFKRESTERGQNARAVSRMLDALRETGRLSEGVRLSNGGQLRIVFHRTNGNGQIAIGDNTVDGRIVALAHDVQKADPATSTILVTKDINLRVKADALGLQAEDYESDHVLIQDLYTGMFELKTSAEKVTRSARKASSTSTAAACIARTSIARCWRTGTRSAPRSPRWTPRA